MPSTERRAEADVQEDPSQISKVEDGEAVGRVGGQDEGYAGETGAERRAEAARSSDQVDDESDESFPASDSPANY